MFHTGFRKGDNKQYCFLIILEKWKSFVDKRKLFAVFFTPALNGVIFCDMALKGPALYLCL